MNVKIFNENNLANVYLTPYCDMYIDQGEMLIINRFFDTSVRIKGKGIVIHNLWSGLNYGISCAAFDSLLAMVDGDSLELKNRLLEGCFVE